MKIAKPFEQGQAEVIFREVVNYSCHPLLSFLCEIRKVAWKNLHIMAFRIVHQGKHVYHNFITPRNQFKKFL